MRTYAGILDQLLRSIEKRDGTSPKATAEMHVVATQEGMAREGIVQVLSNEPWKVRVKMLVLYPELVVPYLFRIRRTSQRK